MSLTYMYSTQWPQGKLFDTESGREHPLAPKQGQVLGGVVWYDSPHYLTMTQDQIVEAAVKQELAKQGEDRELLDKEHQKKFGHEPRGVESDERVEKALDLPHKGKKKK